MKFRIILLLLIACSYSISANAFGFDSLKQKWQIIFTPGISIQTFAFQRWISYPSSYIVQTSLSELNAKGLGLTLPFYIVGKSNRTGLLINPIIRYDLVDPTLKRPPALSDYKIFCDLHLSVFQNFQLGFREKKISFKIGVGYSFISPFISYNERFFIIITAPYPPRLIVRNKINLDFEGIHFFLRFPLIKGFYFKQQLMYVPKGQIIYTGYWHNMMYHASIEVDPKLFKRKRNNQSLK